MSELTGVNLAMQTPIHPDGSIDYVRWEELIDVYIDAGMHGLVLGAGTGQHPYLTQQECNRLFELGVDYYVVKPYEKNDLIDKVNMAIRYGVPESESP